MEIRSRNHRSINMGRSWRGRGRLGIVSLDPPSGFGWAFPHGVTKAGNVYGCDFAIEDYKPAVTVTYYCDPVSGNDGNTGLSMGQALKSIKVAIQKTDVDRIVLKAGTYLGNSGHDGQGVTRSILFEVENGGRAIVVSRPTNTALTSWTQHSGVTYYATLTTTPGSVVDLSRLDAYGMYERLTLAADIDGVVATPGTYFRDGATNRLYVHTFDGRIPDSSIVNTRTSDSNGRFSPTGNNLVCWSEGIDFVGGARAFISGASGTGNKLYFKDCTFQASAPNGGLEVSGDTEVYLVDCGAGNNTLDGFNYSGTVKFLELDCFTGLNGRDGGGGNNSSTSHNTVTGVRINGTYPGSADRAVQDINSAETWNLGCTIGPSLSAGASGVAVVAGSANSQAATIWMDGCTVPAGNFTTDLHAYTGSSILIRNDKSGRALTSGGGGTIGTY